MSDEASDEVKNVAAGAPEDAGSADGCRSASVLVVDDEPMNVDLAVRWLKKAGYRSLVAFSGQQALALAREHAPDVILLDVMMPGIDGYSVCQRMQADAELQHIAIIFVTAHSDPLEKVRGLGLGAADYLSKPYHGEELLARVAAALRLKRAQDNLLRRNRLLEQQVVRDPLTSLYNRVLLDERLHEEIVRAHRYGLSLSCLMIDIDEFKWVNDILGHSAGDALLQATASLISRQARSSDFAARYGGDEFVLVLPQTGRQEALDVAERLRNLASTMVVHVEGCVCHLAVSVGVACYPVDGVDDSAELLHLADQALLDAKARGKNQTATANHTLRQARSSSRPENQEEITMSEPQTRPQVGAEILVVEDEPNNQVLIQKVLTRMGYQWHCVSDGQEAVNAIARHPFALVLMDLSLPGMDGWQAIREIRASGNHVPIIATSAHAMASDREKAADAGATEYITKPFDLQHLRQTLLRYVPVPAAGG